MRVIEDLKEMQAWSDAERRAGRRIALVPTMGCLHEAHLALVREGKKRGERLVVSIFVNPIQFGPAEDYASYPRDLAKDLKLLESEGVALVFHPSPEQMYPAGHQTSVAAEALSRFLCGASRPGHFHGVATVVAKLFNLVKPHAAIFGLKDYQQLLIIQRMAADLNFDVEIVAHPTVRDADGVAMSSRNAYLSAAERRAARSLNRSLEKAGFLVRAGERQSACLLRAVRAELDREPLVQLEYARVCHPQTLEDIDEVRGEALLALAARVGKARLIDNAILKP